MASDVLAQAAKGLPDKYIEMALNYIKFLQSEYCEAKNLHNSNSQFRHPGGLEEKFELPDDFDDTPDCFGGYL